jgi:two-component system, cell cycle response regulator
MTRIANTQAMVCVVDPRGDDYASVAASLAGRDVKLVCFGSGEDALRFRSVISPSMWLINTRLPDMRGADLHNMLRTSDCQIPIAMIGDEYHVDEEIEARGIGVSYFLAKPVNCEMFLAAA